MLLGLPVNENAEAFLDKIGLTIGFFSMIFATDPT